MQTCFEYNYKHAADIKYRFDDGNSIEVDAQMNKRLQINNTNYPLFFTLSRSVADSKNDAVVKRPFQLTIPANIQYKSNQNPHYYLRGFIRHIGKTLHHGHYVTYIQKNGK